MNQTRSHSISKKLLSLILAMIMVLSLMPMTVFAQEDGEPVQQEELDAAQSAQNGEDTRETADPQGAVDTYAANVAAKPDDGTTTGQPFPSGTGGSTNFRIPAIVTLTNGDKDGNHKGRLVASADARWNDYRDCGGIDSIVSYSDDNGGAWTYTFANFLGDNVSNGQLQFVTNSATFIDPAMAYSAKTGTIYMLTDLFIAGYSNLNSPTSRHGKLSGFHTDECLMLAKSGSTSYTYHLDLESGKIYDSQSVETGDTVDAYFNVNGAETDNIFFANASYKAYPASYLCLTSSTDGGASWSAPTLLNLKSDTEQFFGSCPGGGFVTSTGRIMFPCYQVDTLGNTNFYVSFVYSDDNGATWNRNACFNETFSEASISEVTVGDQNYLILFSRGLDGYYYSSDDGNSWTKGTGSIGGWTSSIYGAALGTMTYSGLIDGCPAVLVSGPTSASRYDGKIYVGLVQESGSGISITWKYTYSDIGEINDGQKCSYQYSDLTELADGSIGLLYEGNTETAPRIYYKNIAIEDIAKGATITPATTPTEPEQPEDGAPTIEKPASTSLTVGGDPITLTASETCTWTAEPEGIVTLASADGIAAYAADVSAKSVTVTPVAAGPVTITATNAAGKAATLAISVADPQALTPENVTLYVGQTKTFTQDSTENLEGDFEDDYVKAAWTSVVKPAYTYTAASLGAGDFYVSNKSGDTNPPTPLTFEEYSYYGTVYGYYVKNNSEQYLSLSNGQLTTSASSYYWNVSTDSTTGAVTFSRSIRSGWQYTTYYLTVDANGNLGVSTTSSSIYLYTQNSVDSEGYTTTVTFTGNEPTPDGQPSQVTVGNVQYNVTVKALPPVVTTDDTPFIGGDNIYNTAGTGDDVVGSNGKTVTKLTISYNLTYQLELTSDFDGKNVTWASEDTNLVTVDSTGNVTAGNSVGTTYVTATVDGETYWIPVQVCPGTSDTTTTSDRFFHLYLTEIKDTTVYYVINCDTTSPYQVYEAQQGEVIYVSYKYTSSSSTPGACVDFFGNPDEGYALTRMNSTGAATGYYFKLHTTDSNGNKVLDETEGSGSNGGFFNNQQLGKTQQTAFGAATLRTLLEAMIAKGCDGGMGFTKAVTNVGRTSSSLTFRSEKLPTVDKKIVSVDGVAYVPGMVANAGAQIVFKITVTKYACEDAIEYTNEKLTDLMKIGDGSETSLSIAPSAITISDGKEAATYEFTVSYTVSSSDLEKILVNTANLSYTYSSQYSQGSFGGSASAEAQLTLTDFQPPKDIVIDFGLPVVIKTQPWATSMAAFGAAGTAEYGNVNVAGTNQTGLTITYTPNTMSREVDTVTLTSDRGLQFSFQVIPASTVYYEDENSFVKFDGNWTTVGANDSTATQATSALGSGNIYGTDKAYESSTTYSLGGVHKTTVSKTTNNSNPPTATFTFKGTGFDLVSLTSNTTGTVLLDVTGTRADDNTKVEKHWIVDTYYGYTNGQQKGWIEYTWTFGNDEKWHVTEKQVETAGESGTAPANPEAGDSFKVYKPNYEWTLDNASKNALYQIPVIHYTDLPYGTYTVVVQPRYSSMRDHTSNAGTANASYDFYLDGIRIYNPMGKDYSKYTEDNEGYPTFVELRDQLIGAGSLNVENSTGAVFVDGIPQATLAEYTNYGPNNEVYLAKNQAVAFQVSGAFKTLQIGAKSPNGNAKLSIKVGDNAAVETEIGTATDMYYKVENAAANTTILITNTGEGILSLTTLKFTHANAAETQELVVSQAVADEAVTMLNTLLYAPVDQPEPEPTPDPEPVTFEPGRFEASWGRSVRAGQKATLTVKTSEDVESITVNGETVDIYRPRTERSGWGWWAKKVTYREFTYTVTAAATADYTVIAQNGDGAVSQPITATLTVRGGNSWWGNLFDRWF